MKSAEEIANDLCNEFPNSDIGDCWGLISKVIRAAQIDAAEWMREEAARLCAHASEQHKARANAYFEGRDQGSAIIEKEQADAYSNAVGFIRSIKLPGDGE